MPLHDTTSYLTQSIPTSATLDGRVFFCKKRRKITIRKLSPLNSHFHKFWHFISLFTKWNANHKRQQTNRFWNCFYGWWICERSCVITLENGCLYLLQLTEDFFTLIIFANNRNGSRSCIRSRKIFELSKYCVVAVFARFLSSLLWRPTSLQSASIMKWRFFSSLLKRYHNRKGYKCQ